MKQKEAELRSTQGIVNQIINAESTYQTAGEKRRMAVARLSAMNVAFKDIHNRLLNEAKKEGYYVTEADLLEAKAERKQWIVYLCQFTDWLYRTYSNYNEPIKKAEKDVIKKGAKAPKVIKVNENTLSEKRAEKLLEKAENIQVLSKSLGEKGLTIIPKKLGIVEIESILSDEENVDALILALQERGLI